MIHVICRRRRCLWLAWQGGAHHDGATNKHAGSRGDWLRSLVSQHHVAEVGHLSALWCGAARAASLLLLAPTTGPATQAGPAPPGGETKLLEQ